MNPITLGAVLLAATTGVSEALGGHLTFGATPAPPAQPGDLDAG
jgi:hypothetical protein